MSLKVLRGFTLVAAMACVYVAMDHSEPLTHHPKWHAVVFLLLAVAAAVAMMVVESE
jgi:hypothetical protein